MKKITIYIVLALLCLNFRLQAQENKAVDVTLKGIQIGQKVPDITITNLHNYKNASGKLATTAKLSDFKGKLVILDFWATWCSPCVAMIPKMDSLQKAFGDKIQFLSVTYQTEKEVLPFLEKFEKHQGKHYDLPLVTGSKQLHQLFPHTTLPHYVWIDGSSVVRGITGSAELTTINIEKIIDGSGLGMAKKEDFTVKFDDTKPLFINGNGGDGRDVTFSSTLSGYLEGFHPEISASWINDGNAFKIRATNQSLLSLFKYAYSSGIASVEHNTRLLVAKQEVWTSKEKGEKMRDWRRVNAYSYELVVPKKYFSQMLLWLQQDLARMFPMFIAEVRKDTTDVLALVRTDNKSVYISKHQGQPSASINVNGALLKNSNFYMLTHRLDLIFLQQLGIPVVNDTGYDGPVDLELRANMGNVDAINMALVDYGLKLVKKRLPVTSLTIKDNPNYEVAR